MLFNNQRRANKCAFLPLYPWKTTSISFDNCRTFIIHMEWNLLNKQLATWIEIVLYCNFLKSSNHRIQALTQLTHGSIKIEWITKHLRALISWRCHRERTKYLWTILLRYVIRSGRLWHGSVYSVGIMIVKLTTRVSLTLRPESPLWLRLQRDQGRVLHNSSVGTRPLLPSHEYQHSDNQRQWTKCDCAFRKEVMKYNVDLVKNLGYTLSDSCQLTGRSLFLSVYC